MKLTIAWLSTFFVIFVVALVTAQNETRNPSIEKTKFTLLIDELHQKQLPAAPVVSKSFAAGKKFEAISEN